MPGSEDEESDGEAFKGKVRRYKESKEANMAMKGYISSLLKPKYQRRGYTLVEDGSFLYLYLIGEQVAVFSARRDTLAEVERFIEEKEGKIMASPNMLPPEYQKDGYLLAADEVFAFLYHGDEWIATFHSPFCTLEAIEAFIEKEETK